MYKSTPFRNSLPIITLLIAGLVSCQKENMQPTAVSPNSITNNNPPTSGGPIFVAWSSLGNIPYTDDIAGDVPISNQFPQGFSINGKGFACGSLLTTSWITSDYIGDLWQYDPTTRVWSKKANCPLSGGELIGAINFVIGDNAYIVAQTKTWQYNQPSNTWTQKASVPSVIRDFATAFTINGKGYMGLGWNVNAPGAGLTEMNDWWEYDPATDHWTQKGDFPGTKRQGASGFAIDGKGYAVSGSHYANGTGNWGKTVWQYDPTVDHWTQKANFPGPARSGAVAVNATIGGTNVGLMVGGENKTDALADAWEYYPATDTWGQLPNIPGAARNEAGGFVIARSLYVVNKSVAALTWSR